MTIDQLIRTQYHMALDSLMYTTTTCPTDIYTTTDYINNNPGWVQPYPTALPYPYLNCPQCGMAIGSYQVHQCSNQLASPNLTPRETKNQVFDSVRPSLREEELAQRVSDLEEQMAALLEAVATLRHNNQDEKVHVCAEEGHQGTDSERGPGAASARDRKGDWFWPQS